MERWTCLNCGAIDKWVTVPSEMDIECTECGSMGEFAESPEHAVQALIIIKRELEDELSYYEEGIREVLRHADTKGFVVRDAGWVAISTEEYDRMKSEISFSRSMR